MSQENVEVVRNAFEVIYGSTSEPTATGLSMRRDSRRAAEVLDPNVEVHGTIGGLWEGRIARGLSEMRNSFEAEDLEAWEERRLEPQRFLHIDDLVVVLMREYRAAEAAASKSRRIRRFVFTVREGRVISIQPYMDQAEALEAAGLRE
jgi:ketosteroid isomerase-like protein